MDKYLEKKLAQLAISDDNLKEIRQLLAEGADPNCQIYYGRTPFHVASGSNQDNTEVIKELISSGANVNLSDDWGYTALHYAVMQQKLGVVEILLQSGAFINAKTPHGLTPLHLAVIELTCMHSENSILEMLLDQEDIDCNTRDFNGNTPLMIAVKEKKPAVVELLLYEKANPDIPDNLSTTPLHVAFAEDSKCIAFELLRKGANIYAVDRDGRNPLDILFENMTLDEPSSSALKLLKFIAFRYHIVEETKQKLQRFPEVLQSMEKWCEEVNRMRRDFLIHDTTFHEFILNCYEYPESPKYPVSHINEMHKRMIERLMMGLYPEYFMRTFAFVPVLCLRETLETTVAWRRKSVWRNEPKLFSSADITYLLSLYLSRLDIFCLILSLSNVRIPESMRNIREQKV